MRPQRPHHVSKLAGAPEAGSLNPASASWRADTAAPHSAARKAKKEKIESQKHSLSLRTPPPPNRCKWPWRSRFWRRASSYPEDTTEDAAPAILVIAIAVCTSRLFADIKTMASKAPAVSPRIPTVI